MEESPPVDEAIDELSDFLFRVGLIFGDLDRRAPDVPVGFVYLVKPPIDCEGWRAFLNCSCMFPFCEGLLEGNSCFARSFFGAEDS